MKNRINPIIRRKSNNSYLCSKKLQHLKYSASCYVNFNTIHDHPEGTNYSSLINYSNEADNNTGSRSSSLSLRSSISDNDLNLIGNDNEQTFETPELNLKKENLFTFEEGRRLKQENIDLKTENFKLKQKLNDLKCQLQNAEETNNQLVVDCDLQIKKSKDYVKLYQDLNIKLEYVEKENEDLRDTIKQLKMKETNLLNENSSLKNVLSEKDFLINLNENQLKAANLKLEEKCSVRDRLITEINSQKVFC